MLGMVETQIIQTGVDRLTELVSARKKITLKEASKALGIPEYILESWGESIDENNGNIGVVHNLRERYFIWKTQKSTDFIAPKTVKAMRDTLIVRSKTMFEKIVAQSRRHNAPGQSWTSRSFRLIFSKLKLPFDAHKTLVFAQFKFQ